MPRRPHSFALPFALAALVLLSTTASAQMVKEINAYSPPTLSLTATPTAITICADQPGASVVQLNASAVSPSGLPARYTWRVTGGQIQGEGANVAWDLAGAAPGTYKAIVDIETGSGDATCQAFSTTTISVGPCPIIPACPNIVISCPENPMLGQPVDFRANVAGGKPVVDPIYNWAVTMGTIISGQGTSSIKVDTNGLAGQSLRATLTMGGYPMDCSQSCILSFPIPLECRKFDEFPDIARNDEKARLDNFAIDLQHDPTSTAYIIVHPGVSDRPGVAQRRSSRIVDYMSNTRGIDSRRIVTLVGPARPELMVQLWSCPQGGKPPTP